MSSCVGKSVGQGWVGQLVVLLVLWVCGWVSWWLGVREGLMVEWVYLVVG